MQYTTNYEYKKPGNTDAVEIGVLNSNMDALDADLDALTGTLAIPQHGDTATQAIPAGRYVCWKGNLYTASEDIEEGDTLSASNLTAVTGGGLADAIAEKQRLITTRGAEVRAINVRWSGATVINNEFVTASSVSFANDITEDLPEGRHFAGFAGYTAGDVYLTRMEYNEETNTGGITLYKPGTNKTLGTTTVFYIAL